VALRCAPASKYFELYGKYLAQQRRWVSQTVRYDAIYAVAAQVGMSRSRFDSCRKNQDLINGLKWVKQRGRELGVIGTPNFFVNGKLIKTVLTYDELKAMIDPLLAGRVASR
jgi:protein-disulfide isomerase